MARLAGVIPRVPEGMLTLRPERLQRREGEAAAGGPLRADRGQISAHRSELADVILDLAERVTARLRVDVHGGCAQLWQLTGDLGPAVVVLAPDTRSNQRQAVGVHGRHQYVGDVAPNIDHVGSRAGGPTYWCRPCTPT